MYHLHLNRAALCINCEHIFDSYIYNGKCPVCSSTNSQFLVNWLGGIIERDEEKKALEIIQSHSNNNNTTIKLPNLTLKKSVVRLLHNKEDIC